MKLTTYLALTCVFCTGIVVSSTATIAGGKKNTGDFFKIHAKGKLRTGIAAIGGETTGVLLKSGKGLTVELDFRSNPALRRIAEKLNGKTVEVYGSLTTRRGVTLRRLRWIVQVTKLKEAK